MTDFEAIYSTYFRDVYRFSLSLCQNESLAEEVTQETFCKAMEHLDRFRGDCSYFVWLCQIAKNTYYSLCRRKRHMASEPDALSNIPGEGDLEQAFLDRETGKRLLRRLHRLKEPYKEVFLLRVFGELPYAQIGELFGKTDSWARLIYYRAKQELWRELRDDNL